MKTNFVLVGLLSLLAVSCSLNEMTPSGDEQFVSGEEFYVSIDEQPYADTKVYADEDLKVLWNADDRFSIFNKNTFNQEYVFCGEEGSNAGAIERAGDLGTGDPLGRVYAVYPYDESTSIDESGAISFTLPEEQFYYEKSFGIGANTMVSVTDGNRLRFKNVGGYLSLKLFGKGVPVSSIVLKGNDGELLSGPCFIETAGEAPAVSMASDASTKVTLNCDGVVLGNESDAVQFIFVLPPVTFSKGFKVIVNTPDGAVFTKTTASERVIGRSAITSMSAIEVIPVIPENIVFADPVVEGICVRYWDDNEDGGLSYDEAASVKSLMVDEALTKAGGEVSAFAGTGITTFDELVYFTGLTTIDAGAFVGCTELVSVTIPENVNSIGDNAFDECSSLESITLTSSTPPEVGENAFGDSSDCPIYVPAGSVDVYESTPSWNDYEGRIQANSISFKVPVVCGSYVKEIDNGSLANVLGVSESQLSGYSFLGLFVKDDTGYTPVSASNITGTAEMTSTGFRWSIEPRLMGKMETVYIKYSDSQAEFYLPVNAEKAYVPSFGTANKLANMWFPDIDGEVMNTIRLNVKVPNSNDDDVTLFTGKISRFYIGYKPNYVLTDDSDPVYSELSSEEIAVQYSYRFSSDQPSINGVQLVVDNEGRGLYARSVSTNNLIALLDGDEIVFNWTAGGSIAKQLLNLWSSFETDQSRMFYANVDVDITYGPCNLSAYNERFHVRFIRPLDISLSSQDVTVDPIADGVNIDVAKFISDITDWNKQNVIVPEYVMVGKERVWTGYYMENVINTVNMYKYYGFTKLTVDLDNAERDHYNTGNEYARGKLSAVSPSASLRLGIVDPDTGTFTPLSSNEIDITDFANLKGCAINYDDNSAAETFNLFIPVTIEYSWGTFRDYFMVKVRY